jgi:hypothetical protein
MNFQGVLRAGLAAVAFVLVIAASAVAQQYQILRADYGYGDRRVDVTQRLRELARSDTTFRMGNSTFGVDPAPGQVKSLRIFARGAGGETRTFEYREGSVIEGAMFSGWGSGDWGWDAADNGQYQILEARYGAAENNIDVTQRLKELARQDRTFRMGNSTFGVDPDPGRVKTLRIYTRGPGGANRMFEYREGSVVDGSMFTGWGRGEWGRGGRDGGWSDGNGDEGQYQILEARYGTAHRNIDVTQRLKELARRDITFRMGNSTFGEDPDPGHSKILRIYTRGPNSQNRMFEYREGSVVDGAMFTGWGRGEWGHGGWEGGWGDGDDEGHQHSFRQDHNATLLLGREVVERDFGGGSGGRTVADARCDGGFVAVAFHVQTGEYFNQAWLDCARMRSDGTLGEEHYTTARTGSAGGRAVHDAQCRPGKVLRGLKGRTGASIDEAIGECSSLRAVGDGNDSTRTEMTNPVVIPRPGGRPAEAQCPSGSVLVGLRSRSGEWMDHLWILCSEVQRAY